MKTLIKSIAALCIVFFTITGTTSCKKDSLNPTSTGDERLIDKWENQEFLGNNVSVTQITFNANGTGTQRTFHLDDGATQISNERITNFSWSFKSEGVLRIKNDNNEEGDVQFFITDSGDALRLTLPSGEQMILSRFN